MKQKVPLIFVTASILLGIFIRFYALRLIPLGYYFDEMDYVFTGEAIARFGTDITGAWSPWSLRPLQLINNISELASVFHAISQKIFGFGDVTGHLPSALFGLFSAGITGLISLKLTKKKLLASIVTATLLVSPWHIYISRVSYEGVISLTFQLLMVFGFVVFLFRKKHSLQSTLAALVICVVGAFFGYYTYHGAKFTVVTVGGVLALYTLLTSYKSKEFRNSIFLTVPLLLILGGMLLHSAYLKSQGAFGSRESEIIFNQIELTQQVDEYRKKSLEFPGKSLIISKPTIFVENVIKRYFNVFDIYQWGITGEENLFQFSLFVHGFIYLSSLVFVIFGFRYFWNTYRKQTYFLLITIAVAPVTNVLSNFSSQSIFRSALVYALGLIFIGAGVYWLSQKHWKLFAVAVPVLLFEIVFFAAAFFGRYPIVTADNHYFHQHLLANYVGRIHEPVTIITSDNSQSYTLARSIIYYNQLIPSLSEEERTQFASIQSEYGFGNIHITTACPKDLTSKLDYEKPITIFWASKIEECDVPELNKATYFANHQELDPLIDPVPYQPLKGLGSPIDSRIYFGIVNDPLCSLDHLNRYVYQTSLHSFDLTSQTDETFCKNWMLKE